MHKKLFILNEYHGSDLSDYKLYRIFYIKIDTTDRFYRITVTSYTYWGTSS